jgi:hypothetical protein
VIITRSSIGQIVAPIAIISGLASAVLVLSFVIPFTSSEASVLPAYILYASFYIIIIIVYLLLSLVLNAAHPQMASTISGPSLYLNDMMKFACWVALIGVACLVIDRALYQGVDFFTESFVQIRSRLSRERIAGSISSPFSLVGNILQFWYFLPLVCLVFYYEYFAPRQRGVIILLILLNIFTGSYVLGGRSILALAALTTISTLVARGGARRPVYGMLLRPKALMALLMASVFCIGLVIYVFYARASAGGDNSTAYLNTFVAHLHGMPVSTYEACDAGVYCDLINYAQLSALYGVHVFWVLAESMNYLPTAAGGSALWGGVLNLFQKIVEIDNGSYQYAGLFNSLAGSIFYEYGWLGMTVGAILLAAALAVLNFLLARSAGILKLIIYVLVFDTLLISPVLSSLNVIMFIFVAASLFIVAFIYLAVLSIFKGAAIK